MMGRIDRYGKYYWITGIRNVKTNNLEDLMRKFREDPESILQIFNADLIASWEHIFFATLNALKSFESGRNISRHLEMEILLYASTQRQIKNALELIGVKPDVKDIAVIILSDSKDRLLECISEVEEFFGGERDENILSIDSRKFDSIKEAFKITDEEIESMSGIRSREEALKYLVIEHMALLRIQK